MRYISPSKRIESIEAHQSAQQLFDCMGLSFNHQTGLYSITFQQGQINTVVDGLLGDILTHEKFDMPMAQSEVEKINVAAEIGFLAAKRYLDINNG